MSDAEEPVDPQTTTDSTADVDSTSVSEAAADVISIPRPSEEAEGSDVTRGRESETGEFITESEEMAEAPSERSISSAKSYDTKHRDEGGSTEKSSLTQEDEQKDATYQRPEDDLRFLTQIQEIKEIVQRTIKESSATVKIVLIPIAQEIIMPFRVDAPFRLLKEHFARLLRLPHYVLQISHSVLVFIILDAEHFEEVAVEIIKSDFHKPFLGGFKHKITGVEYHNAGTQTVPKKAPEKPHQFCRNTQVIVIQTYYRQWHAKCFVESLRQQKKRRLEWEKEQELKKMREKEEWLKMDYYRRHNPKTREDFELLYNALEPPKIWRRPDGQDIEMDTQFTIRARELQSIYQCIMLKDLSQDERLDILLTLKHTVKEHECKLTQEILELIDREVDLMMRGVKTNNLEGLRKRITTLLFHYIKTPLFNPEVARHLKVPQDPLKFYDKIYFCHSCQLYLPSVEFSVSPTLRRMYRCRHCVNLENEIEKRESFLKYKCLLQRLYFSEADFADDSQIAYLMQLQDIKYLTENIWASQSVLSAWDDLNDLVMVRWDKSMEWSPWNCILLTKDEGAAHLKLESIEEGYERLFIHKIKHKHILAKNYFSQVPVLASILLADSELEDIRSKHCTDKPPKIIEARGSHT
ncbi:IQ motif and ubiquitin domain containing [Cricetulus griseus]